MKQQIYKIVSNCFCLFPIKKKRVLFISYYGEQYGCNPKYLSEYIIENKLDWDVVWALNNNKQYKDIFKFAKYLSLRYFFYLATSKVIVSNYRMPLDFNKRSGQIYVQTWHSSLRLKKIEADAADTIPPHYIKMAKHDSEQIDLLLSGCRKSTNIFRSCFWYNGEILASGTPRCDCLVKTNKNKRESLRASLNIDNDDFVVLYAPTFRKDNSIDCYNVDFVSVCDALSKRFNKKVKILLRLHPHLKDYSNAVLTSAKAIMTDVTRYDDIQELLMVSDLLISDYSGLIFDFMLTNRPCVLYTPDLENYISSDRELYFNINELPFPICRNNNELIAEIKRLKLNEFASKYAIFNEFVGSYEDGNACKRVINKLEELVNNGQ